MATTLDPRVILAVYLVKLGLATAEQIKKMWADDEDDDVLLDSLIAQLDRRIARRSTPPVA